MSLLVYDAGERGSGTHQSTQQSNQSHQNFGTHGGHHVVVRSDRRHGLVGRFVGKSPHHQCCWQSYTVRVNVSHWLVYADGVREQVVAESLLDRLINTSQQVVMSGPSYRPNKRPKAAITKA